MDRLVAAFRQPVDTQRPLPLHGIKATHTGKPLPNPQDRPNHGVITPMPNRRGIVRNIRDLASHVLV
jgi:hypothetical protein